MQLKDMISQCTGDSARWFPGEAQSLANLVLCMCGEAGEVANIVKKVVRGSLSIEQVTDPQVMGDLGKDTLQEEIIDVLIYLCNLMGLKEFKDVDWTTIWYDKRDFNEQRFGA